MLQAMTVSLIVFCPTYWQIALQEQKAKPEYADDINPISRLIQIQQAKKEREPEYTLLEERGVPRRREFVMEVTNLLSSHLLEVILETSQWIKQYF